MFEPALPACGVPLRRKRADQLLSVASSIAADKPTSRAMAEAMSQRTVLRYSPTSSSSMRSARKSAMICRVTAATSDAAGNRARAAGGPAPRRRSSWYRARCRQWQSRQARAVARGRRAPKRSSSPSFLCRKVGRFKPIGSGTDKGSGSRCAHCEQTAPGRCACQAPARVRLAQRCCAAAVHCGRICRTNARSGRETFHCRRAARQAMFGSSGRRARRRSCSRRRERTR